MGAPTWLVVAVFALSYVLIATRSLRLLPIGRPAGALLGAVGMVAIGALTPDESYAAVDHGTVLLLFGMMALTTYAERAGLFGEVTVLLARWCRTPWSLLVAVAVAAAVLSAFLVNDTVCLFLTPIVVRTCLRHRLPLAPYLIALATSANIGSAATLVGNPQNMIVGALSGLTFARYATIAAPAALAALLVNVALLRLFYGKRLPVRWVPGTAPDATPRPSHPWLVALVLLGVVAGFFAGLHLAYTTAAGVVVLVLLERRDPQEVLARIDWPLLLFFACLFITVEGLARTGLIEDAWAASAPHIAPADAGGVLAFSGLVTAGSQVFSNVPLVLAVGPHVGGLASPERAFVLLAFVSTLAGNLTLVGSVANLIVAERARPHHELGFREYLRFGVVSTAATLAVGIPLVTALT